MSCEQRLFATGNHNSSILVQGRKVFRDKQWEDHIKSTHNKEIDQLIKEYKAFINEKMNEGNQGFITESGDVEKWVGGINKDRAQEALDE